MKQLYGSPLRVYLLLSLLAVAGVWTGLSLPVSLFPNVTQPHVYAYFPLKGMTSEDFRSRYGATLEGKLRQLKTAQVRVENVEASYGSDASYEITCDWQSDPEAAKREITAVVDAFAAGLPEENREGRGIYSGGSRRNSGFFLASYLSDQRPLSEVYALVEPLLTPRLASLEDGDKISIANPDAEEIAIQLKSDAMASLGILPQDVVNSVRASLRESSAGSLTIGGMPHGITIPRSLASPEDVSKILVSAPGKVLVQLSTIATIQLKRSGKMLFKTSGVQSILVNAQPKEGGNVKRLSEEIKEKMAEIAPLLPPDIKYRVLIDPSIFVRRSVLHVVQEVAIGAGLAVAILFLFIGSVRNVITAAIEIPLSLVLAFLLMKLFHMNVNLVSLGGLALSAGMNVDASVVVMENIFRKFAGVNARVLSAGQRLHLVTEAVREVFVPLLSSTVASLVVFIPIIFTSDLTHAILGDLAKAVVFSHSFSAVVALILVPTVRLHLMDRAAKKEAVAGSIPLNEQEVVIKAKGTKSDSDSQLGDPNEERSPLGTLLEKLDSWYARVLGFLLQKPLRIVSLVCAAGVAVFLLFTQVIPRLPREIIGKPNSSLIGIYANGRKFTRIEQMEGLLAEVERKIGKELPDTCNFTFTQIWDATGGNLICELRDKEQLSAALEKMEKTFPSTPESHLNVFQWNLGELPLPKSADFLLTLSGGTREQRAFVLDSVIDGLYAGARDFNFYSNINTNPRRDLSLRPIPEVWARIASSGFARSPADILESLRIHLQGSDLGSLNTGAKGLGLSILGQRKQVQDVEEIMSFPVAVGEKIVPIRAFFAMNTQAVLPEIMFRNGEAALEIEGHANFRKGEHPKTATAEARAAFQAWAASSPLAKGEVHVVESPADLEVQKAIRQLATAALWSVAMIFVTMLIQFGNIIESLLVLLAIPFALIGVLLSLYLFGSTLSLNSVLGMILLNGIAVANSILLVDLAKRLHRTGMSPSQAVISAARQRLRPILITSLTTILGMVPIASGFGEGGKVLQPLGIAVSGGMWVSMILTLLMVPVLHGWVLKRRGQGTNDELAGSETLSPV